jgi:hypothetical protein
MLYKCTFDNSTLYNQVAFANRLAPYSCNLCWVKIIPQKLITLFSYPYNNHNVNAFMCFVVVVIDISNSVECR